MKQIIFVGGGISSIVGSILAKKKYPSANITVVERESKAGGLLKSSYVNGHWFDYGTHIPNLSNNDSLNEILLPEEQHQHFNFFEFLQVSNFFRGSWNYKSALINVNNEPNKSQIETELLERKNSFSSTKNLGTHISENLGPTAKKDIYIPVFQKLFDASPDELHIAADIFNLKRLIAFDEERANQLKLNGYDHNIGFHNSNQNVGNLKFFYPKNGGIGYWIETLINRMKALGVELLTNTEIKKVNFHEDQVFSIDCQNGDTIKCDHVIWTGTPVLLFKLLGLNLSGGRPHLRTTHLFHMEAQLTPNLANTQYSWNWDPDYKTFRYTFYEQLRKDGRGIFTAEALTNYGEELSSEDIIDELTRPSLSFANGNIRILGHDKITNTFPKITDSFISNGIKNYQTLDTSFKNLHIIGRSSGKAWLTNDILNQMARLIDCL